MKRTTIFLDDVAERELGALAQQDGVAKASLVREAIVEYLTRRREVAETPLGFIGIGRSGRADIAERHEELLFHEPGREQIAMTSRPARAAAPPRRRQRKGK